MDYTEFEQEARQRSQRLEEPGRLPQGFTGERYPPTTSELLEYRRLKACLHLATDADTFVALAQGRTVPASRLDPNILNEHHRRCH